jgi:hypothetical protein
MKNTEDDPLQEKQEDDGVEQDQQSTQVDSMKDEIHSSVNQHVAHATIEAPDPELLEKALSDPRVHYVASLSELDCTDEGGPIVNASQYYSAWSESTEDKGSAGIYTFDDFIMPPLKNAMQRDLAPSFPVAVRGIALNIGDTINESGIEVLGISEVLNLGTERPARTGTQIPRLLYDSGDPFPFRSLQWLHQSPIDLRHDLPEEYQQNIFPAVLVYKAEAPDLISIYIVDYLDERKGLRTEVSGSQRNTQNTSDI